MSKTNPEKEGELLMVKVQELIKKEGGAETPRLSKDEEIEKYLLPALDRFRGTLKFVYEPFTYKSSNPIVQLKNTALNKIGNVARNVTEKSFMRQQKYNDSVYTMLLNLYKENKELKEKIEKLEKSNGK